MTTRAEPTGEERTGRREDARRLARLVRSDECGGLARAETAAALGWAENGGRFRAAMFYAYAAGWITFCLDYLCHPGPGPAAPRPLAPACRRDHGQAAEGARPMIAQTTPATAGNKASHHQKSFSLQNTE
jgi:hypothetical protein